MKILRGEDGTQKYGLHFVSLLFSGAFIISSVQKKKPTAT